MIDKKYKIVYADPPWEYNDKLKLQNEGAVQHYPTMALKDICDLQLPTMADNCVLFLWVTHPMIQEGLDVIKAWGFEYKTVAFTWIKKNRRGVGLFYGLGRWTRGNPELCLLAVRGRPKRIRNDVNQLVFSRLRKHSQKPDEVRNRIVQLCGDLPRIELFARDRFVGWDTWGNQVIVGTQQILDATQYINHKIIKGK